MDWLDWVLIHISATLLCFNVSYLKFYYMQPHYPIWLSQKKKDIFLGIIIISFIPVVNLYFTLVALLRILEYYLFTKKGALKK